MCTFIELDMLYMVYCTLVRKYELLNGAIKSGYIYYKIKYNDISSSPHTYKAIKSRWILNMKSKSLKF